MTYRQVRPLVLFILALVVVTPAIVGAELKTIVPCNPTIGADGKMTGACTVCHIAQVAQNVLNDGIYIAVFLSAILFAWAGFLYLTNVASEGQQSKAKSVFSSVLIGLLIILAAWLVIDTLMKTLVPDSGGFGPWNQICKEK